MKRCFSMFVSAAFLVSMAGYAAAESIQVRVHKITSKGVGAELGTITLAATAGGVSFTPNLAGFDPGPHAFHVHAHPNCGPGTSDGTQVAGFAAGPHYGGSDGHHGPQAHKHMAMRGDLPELLASAGGAITGPVTKAGLTLDELHGRSLMIHAYGEKAPDPSKPAGGGGRIACGVIP